MYQLWSGLGPILFPIFAIVLWSVVNARLLNARRRPATAAVSVIKTDWAKVYEIEREIWQQTFYHDGAPSPEEVARQPDPVIRSALADGIAAITSASPAPASFTSTPVSADGMGYWSTAPQQLPSAAMRGPASADVMPGMDPTWTIKMLRTKRLNVWAEGEGTRRERGCPRIHRGRDESLGRPAEVA